MRYSEDHKEKTRNKVLEAAARAIRAQGPHRVGVAGVMKQAGLTHGGFYAHFESRDDLVAAAIGQMFKESRARFMQVTESLPPLEALAAYIDFYLSRSHRDALTSGCAIAALAADVRRVPVEARAGFAQGVANLTERLAERLRTLGRAQPELEASSMLAELVGALSLSRGEPDDERSAAILAASRASLRRRLQLQS
jgi:TetR/AcrR family transcriptional repressor of nem operon